MACRHSTMVWVGDENSCHRWLGHKQYRFGEDRQPVVIVVCPRKFLALLSSLMLGAQVREGGTRPPLPEGVMLYGRRRIGQHTSDGGPRSAVTPWPSAPELALTGRVSEGSGNAGASPLDVEVAARLAKGGSFGACQTGRLAVHSMSDNGARSTVAIGPEGISDASGPLHVLARGRPSCAGG